MVDHDESLEIGIAAGMDVPTALIVSENDNKPPKPAGKGCLRIAAFFIVLAIFVLAYLFL